MKPEDENESDELPKNEEIEATEKKEEVADLTTQELEKARKEMLYLRADFENSRKRMAKEQEQSIRFGQEKLIKELLHVVDIFERALVHAAPLKAKDDKELNGFVTGIEMTHAEFVQLLTRSGVELVGQVGEKFDPVKHEAISDRPAMSGEEGTVVEVLEKGSLLHGRLLKPAKVIVGK